MSNEIRKFEELRRELVKQEVEYLTQERAILNEHGVYYYQSKCGNHIISLDSYLNSYKEWLIEKGYVREVY